ncbi:MAG: OmpA family protein [Myxococcus sp.]|nr:OmpA family protein [Myxococcus sp.]
MRQLTALVFVVSTLALTGCPPTYPNCKSDENCTEKGEVCVQGQCRECATDENCKPGFVCDTNKCVPKPECGPGVGPCGTGKKCSGGKCLVDPNYKPEGTCSTNEDCPSGQTCQGGRCAAPVTVKDACTFESVRFEFNEFSLTSAAQSTLAQYADCIKKGSLRFTLEGHADERGTEEYNMVLSQKRAASVRKYLVDLGVAGGALDTVGYGENKPVASGSNEAAWAANRRVEFKRK